MAGALPPWCLVPVNAHVVQLQDARGLHLGNLKLINGQWKFKAIGFDADGQVIPGGGPLTHRHNTVLERLDALALAALAPEGGPPRAV
jgi:hypothetical protein